MGICLDTEANSSAVDPEESEWKDSRSDSRLATTSNMPLENTGKVKFDPPAVPVIFVLGGPGSGKVTHCDTLMEEKRGVTHINMMDLLHQHVISNDMQDFSQLPSKMVTEVLMLEMKMAPAAKAYLVSGFPRSMRDVVEYSDKIQVVNGVVLIAWRQTVLQKQIDYGAKLGHVVLSLAKMELDNFFKNVIPVADYFDQSSLLVTVNGERNPAEVYKDFRNSIFEILGAEDDQNGLLNGVIGMGRGANEIPGSIVSVETAPEQTNAYGRSSASSTILSPANLLAQSRKIDVANLPPIIWVIGGPGSNKTTLGMKAVALNPGWAHLSLGKILRAIADSEPKANTDNHKIKTSIVAGELVKRSLIANLLEAHLALFADKKGIVIDGYPRDAQQVRDFEEKYHQTPPVVLLDCSKLQLGRGRLDDTVASFRRRLEQFRELTLPMLKNLDTTGRLTIIDGDTDNLSVQREFERVIRQQTTRLASNIKPQHPHVEINIIPDSEIQNDGQYYHNQQQQQHQQQQQQQEQQQQQQHTIIEDLDNMPGTVPTISNHISQYHNTKITNDTENHYNNNITTNKMNNNTNDGQQTIANGSKTFRSMLEEAETHPIDL